MNDKNEANKYVEKAIVHRECTLTGNYRRGNVAASYIEKINEKLLNGKKENAYCFIDKVLCSDNPNAIMWIVPVCIALEYRVEFIESKLRTYSMDKSLGILSFNASMLLKSIKV